MFKTKNTFLFCMFFLLTNILFAQGIEKDWLITTVYTNKIPENIIVNTKYKMSIPKVLEYAYVVTEDADILEYPDESSKVLKTAVFNEKIPIVEKIYHNYVNWYTVSLGGGKKGYVSSYYVEKRVFRFQRALDKIQEIEDFITEEKKLNRSIESVNSYAPNPNNANMSRATDKYGMTKDQNTIGISKGEEIYIPDRSIVSIIKRGEKTSLVKVPTIPEELEVSNAKLTKKPDVGTSFGKVIAIDLTNQNMMIFEKNSANKWEMISHIYSKTGIESALGFETPEGFFTSPMAKYVMHFNDGNGTPQGYARYAIRFSGGGYLHGTPLAHSEDSNRDYFMKIKEKGLGTTTGTRKCIRTTEPHAKWLFDWMVKTPKKANNEQTPDSKVVFVTFH